MDGGGGGFDDAGAGHVADGAASDEAFFEGFSVVVVAGEVVGVGEQDAVAVDGEAFVGEVDGRYRDVFLEDVLPDVQFGPVAEGEDSEVFAVVAAAVVEVPEFRSLVFGVPLAEFVSVAEEAFFGACFFFVASSAADAGVEVFFFDGVEECGGLEVVAAGVASFFFDDASGVDAVLDGSDKEVNTEVFDEVVTEGECFGEVMAGVNMEEGVGDGCGLECFFAEVGEHDAVFTAAEEEGGSMELCADFSKDENSFAFEFLKVVDGVRGHDDTGSFTRVVPPLMLEGFQGEGILWCGMGP